MPTEIRVDRIPAKDIGSLIKGAAETAFKEVVQNSDEIKNILARIKSASNRVPRARASVQVNTVAGWFDIYRKHMKWDNKFLEEGIEKLAQAEGNDSLLPIEIVQILRPALQDIIINPGLVEITLSSEAYNRINVSNPLLNAQRLVTLLKKMLMVYGLKALTDSIELNLDLIIPEKNENVERDLNDDSGSVVFRADNGLLEVVSGLPSEQSDLKILVADSLSDLFESQILDIAEQKNKRTGALIRSFRDCFESDISGADLKLYAAVIKLFTAMGSFENPTYEDDRPPQEFIDAVKTLLIHHEAYIWTFPRIKSLIELRTKTRESYGVTVTDRTRLQSALLRALNQAEDVVGERSRAVISIVEDAISTSSPSSIGPEAIQYGILRGALQFMGRIIVQSRKTTAKILENTAIRVASTALATMFISTPLYNAVIRFFNENVQEVMKLSVSAQDWHWLQLVISFVRHL